MKLFFDPADEQHAAKLRDHRLDWLRELGATELNDATPEDEGFLFGYQLGRAAHEAQVASLPLIRDRPEERDALIRLDDILAQLAAAGVNVPTPRTWILRVDEPPPNDLEFPLFVRTPASSWKRGGKQGRANNLKQLDDEVELLRRAFGWDTPILARAWLEIAPAGKWTFGDAPQEVRVWIVDGTPIAWAFHYLHAVPSPKGFPPKADELAHLGKLAAQVAKPFHARLIVADFVKDRQKQWHFLEAGPGAIAGTAHEAVFKYVAARMIGQEIELKSDRVGGALST